MSSKPRLGVQQQQQLLPGVVQKVLQRPLQAVLQVGLFKVERGQVTVTGQLLRR